MSNPCNIPLAPIVTTSTVVYVTNPVAYGKVQFRVGDSGAPMTNGNTVYVIQGTGGAPIKNIKTGSVNVALDGVSLSEGESDQISYTVVYTASATTVTFTNVPAGLLNEQKVKITYVKSI